MTGATTANKKGPTACDDRAPGTTTNAADSAACPGFDQPSPEKYRAGVLARAALVGVAVIELSDGSYLATWRGWLKPCPDLAAVQHLVRQLTPGGAA